MLVLIDFPDSIFLTFVRVTTYANIMCVRFVRLAACLHHY